MRASVSSRFFGIVDRCSRKVPGEKIGEGVASALGNLQEEVDRGSGGLPSGSPFVRVWQLGGLGTGVDCSGIVLRWGVLVKQFFQLAERQHGVKV